MRWGVLWDFEEDGSDRWLDDFVPAGRQSFVKIPTGYHEASWHERKGARSKISRWTHSGLTRLDRAQVDGVVTLFPPLAAMVGVRNRLKIKPYRHVAWAFNLGHHPAGWKRLASRVALSHIDRIVVHSAAEVAIVRDLFELAEGQVEFVHLQGPERPVLAEEDRTSPFIAAIGSANRDYVTLIEALRVTGLRAKIVTSPRLVEGLNPPPHVEIIAGASWLDCLALAQQARMCVTPLARPEIATGQVTIIDHLTMGRTVVATRSIGTVDYVEDGVTGVLVEPGDVAGLAATLQRLWDDAAERAGLERAAQDFAQSTLSDPAIGRRLGAVLDAVERERERP